MLASGLPERVDDSEDLARFLTSTSQYNAQMAKPSAFLPSAKDHEASVFRYGSEPRATLWAIGDQYAAGNRTIHGAAIVKALEVRAAMLEITAAEPPPRHAAIQGWPIDNDPELQKAQRKERALQVASKAALILRQ
jgi:hypothetical protein